MVVSQNPKDSQGDKVPETVDSLVASRLPLRTEARFQQTNTMPMPQLSAAHAGEAACIIFGECANDRGFGHAAH